MSGPTLTIAVRERLRIARRMRLAEQCHDDDERLDLIACIAWGPERLVGEHALESALADTKVGLDLPKRSATIT
jgi:hypothetical protein